MKNRACPTVFCVLMVAALVVVPQNGRAKAGKERFQVNIDYNTGLLQPFGRVELSEGDTLVVRIFNLKEGVDYAIEVMGVEVPPQDRNKWTRDVGLGPTETIIEIKHNSIYQSYRLTVKEKGETESLFWVIPVFTHTWALDFSGAFTFDWLKSRVYFLEKGTQPDAVLDESPDGFFVRRNTDAEDRVGLGAAAMVHLYHTKYFHCCKKTLAWAPLSFGLGVGGNTETRYYLGTSLRFGDVFFLTAGAVFGKVDCLPANLTEGGFVVDGSALATMGRRSDVAFFLGISYAFAGKKAKEQIEQTFGLSE